jgi:hypothetical protein
MIQHRDNFFHATIESLSQRDAKLPLDSCNVNSVHQDSKELTVTPISFTHHAMALHATQLYCYEENRLVIDFYN